MPLDGVITDPYLNDNNNSSSGDRDNNGCINQDKCSNSNSDRISLLNIGLQVSIQHCLK